ncbi:MAG: T9SS type A sorting domain-containing protein [Bacteroidales bacterium]|nr:T9SS type A sorting domain-containing protein [Candidatus Sodaliphilus limicaballi]
MRQFLVNVALVLALSLSISAVAQQMQWREATHEVQGRSLVDSRVTDGVEIFGSNGVITIRTTKKVQVRVFTILGQSVSVATLNPGTSELKVGARGVYIVKIGNLTQKVAL